MLMIVSSGRFVRWRSLRRALQAEERLFTVTNADGGRGNGNWFSVAEA